MIAFFCLDMTHRPPEGNRDVPTHCANDPAKCAVFSGLVGGQRKQQALSPTLTSAPVSQSPTPQQSPLSCSCLVLVCVLRIGVISLGLPKSVKAP